MKLWKKPEMKNIGLNQTKEGEACANETVGASLLPDYIFFCSHWYKPWDRRCTHKNYGSQWHIWPCEQYKKDGNNDNDGDMFPSS